jgi:DnaJ-class molecular chaperone
MKKRICPRCKGNGYIKVIKEVTWPQKQEEIVVQCPQCKSEGEIEDVREKIKKLNS